MKCRDRNDSAGNSVFSSELSHKLAELICHTEIFLKGKYIFREGEEVSVTTVLKVTPVVLFSS